MSAEDATISAERDAGLSHGMLSGDVALVVNTRSRGGDRMFKQARTLLRDKGIRLAHCYPVRDPGRLPEAVRHVISKGCGLVIVGGGDGTVSSVVDDFAYRDVIFGLLPLGTANSFARTLDIPLTVAEAVEVIVSGKVACVDLGKINEDYYANIAALGLSPAIGRSVPHLAKRYLGKLGYLMTAAYRFPFYRSFECSITLPDTVPLDFQALEVLIANGRYHGGTLLVRQADVESSDLVVHMVIGTERWRLLWAWLRAWIGQPDAPATTAVVRGTEFVIETQPPQDVSVDGEVVTRTPIHCTVAEKALRIMVPNDFTYRQFEAKDTEAA